MGNNRADMQDIQSSRNYNPRTLRLDYPAAFLEAMPTKKVTPQEIYELKMTLQYNPGDMYFHLVKPYKGEMGHDDKYRYIVIPTLEATQERKDI